MKDCRNHRSPTTPLRKQALPKSFPLYRTISNRNRPTPREFDVAIFTCDFLVLKVLGSQAPVVWDDPEWQKIIPSQASWLRALITDVVGTAPYTQEPRLRGGAHATYLRKAEKELRAVSRDLSRVPAPKSPFSPLEELLK